MIKNSRIELGKTPSEDKGEPCKTIISGNPVTEPEEQETSFDKIAKLVKEDDSQDDCDDSCCCQSS